MHDSTMIEPSYVSGGAREFKASCWPANRGVLHRRRGRQRNGREVKIGARIGEVHCRGFSAIFDGDNRDGERIERGDYE